MLDYYLTEDNLLKSYLMMLAMMIVWPEIAFVIQVEEDLLTEKYKIKKISDDLNQTFEDMINMSV